MAGIGAGVVLRPSQGQHGTMFVLGSRATRDDAAPSVIVEAEQYNMIVNAMKAGSPVKLRIDVRAEYQTADTNGDNVIGEIPGSDPTLGTEVVLLGAHLDSWHSATGATDNADASASLIEAMRILQSLGVRPRRTIRMALWGGEEQGLLGSRAYAARHYAGPANAGAREKLSVYLNSDPGSGPIFGWYMEENATAKSLFDAWLAPLKDLGMRRNVSAKIGNTDHLAFTELGLPAFNSLQDYVEYDQREHHTNADFAERVSESDLKKNAIVLASFAWLAANRDQKIPRGTHPLPCRSALPDLPGHGTFVARSPTPIPFSRITDHARHRHPAHRSSAHCLRPEGSGATGRQDGRGLRRHLRGHHDPRRRGRTGPFHDDWHRRRHLMDDVTRRPTQRPAHGLGRQRQPDRPDG